MNSEKGSTQIPDTLLKKYHGKIVEYQKGETIFRQGEVGTTFMIVRRGRVKMATVNEEGKEFVQGYFEEGSSFGEPPFFTGTEYPASAIALTDCEIWKVGRQYFLRLLKENFAVHLSITESLSSRLEYKSMMLSELAVEEAHHRIMTLLTYFREREGRHGSSYEVPFSRQQIADMCGLRVETVIRVVKSMEQQRLLGIDEEGKIILS